MAVSKALRAGCLLILLQSTGVSEAQAQVSFDNLELASDLRFFAGHCFAIKADWNGMETYMRSRGIPMDVFDRGTMDNAYIEARDRNHEKDLKTLGTNAFCKRYYLRYYKTGLFRQLNTAELKELNRIRMSNGGDEIQALE